MLRDAIAVTGIGVVSPAGTGVAATWKGVCSGVSFAAADPVLEGSPVDFSCAVPGWDADAVLGRKLCRRLDRPAQMAVVAAREAVHDAGLCLARRDPSRIGVIVGAGTASFDGVPDVCRKLAAGRHALVSPMALVRSLPSSAASEIARDLGAQGPCFAPAAACASGSMAIGLALQLLRTGMLDVVVAGGAESGRTPISAACFSQMGVLSTRKDDPQGASRPFDAGRSGFVLGEGAGMLVLERTDHARARGARPRASLVGYGSATDAYHVTAPHPEGRGLQQALRACLADSSLVPAEVDHINVHGTATRINDTIEADALSAVFPRVPPVTAAKGALGHALGASGAIEAALSVMTLQHQTIPPTANLESLDPAICIDVVTKECRPARMRTVISSSVAFGGHNAALVFRAAEDGEN